MLDDIKQPESELFNCLNNGKLTCAGLDVFETEPALKNNLLNSDNFIGTPHIAASTVEAQIRVGLESANQMQMSGSGSGMAEFMEKMENMLQLFLIVMILKNR